MPGRNNKTIVIGFLLVLVVSNYLTYSLTLWSPPFRQNAEYTFGQEDERVNDREFFREDEKGEFGLLFEIVNLLREKYIDIIDEETLLQGAVEGMLDSLGDPQTKYLGNEEINELLTFLKGSFGGIGVRILETANGIMVVEVIPGTPAEEAKLKPGDRVCAVEGIDLQGESVARAVELIRGKQGTEVAMEVERPGTEDKLEFSISREEINFQTVVGEWLEPGLAYIRISQFDGLTGDEFIRVFKEMEREGIEGLVLDLRDNPGGVLGEALKVARLLVPEGEITRMVDRDGEVVEKYYSEAPAGDFPMVVLINSGSASGSEIIAGALRDRGAAVLVGESTYGKATVQHFDTFSGGDGIRFTVAKYVTPAGNDLHGEGLKPDHEVELPIFFYYYRYLSPGIMEEGDYGDSVYILQAILADIGHNTPMTGFFDEATTNALQTFQRSRGLSDHGKFDELTWIHLFREMENLIKEKDNQIQKALELLK